MTDRQENIATHKIIVICLSVFLFLCVFYHNRQENYIFSVGCSDIDRNILVSSSVYVTSRLIAHPGRRRPCDIPTKGAT